MQVETIALLQSYASTVFRTDSLQAEKKRAVIGFVLTLLCVGSRKIKIHLKLLEAINLASSALLADTDVTGAARDLVTIAPVAASELAQSGGISHTTRMHIKVAAHAALGMKAMLKKINPLYPSRIHIETQAICNAKCSFCDYSRLKRKGVIMDTSLLDKILLDLSEIPLDHSFVIQPYKISEPFLDSRLPEIIKKCLDFHPASKVHIISNGNFMPERTLQALIGERSYDVGKHEANQSSIEGSIAGRISYTFSLNEIDPRKYSELMKLSLSRTLHNLDLLHSKANDLGSRMPKISLARVSLDHSSDVEFIKFCRSRFPLFELNLSKLNDWAETNEFSSSHELSSAPPTYSFRQLPCTRWGDLSITATGDVALCCMDSGELNLALGNVRKSNCLELYQKKYARFARHTRDSSPSPCVGCTYLQGDLKVKQYLNPQMIAQVAGNI